MIKHEAAEIIEHGTDEQRADLANTLMSCAYVAMMRYATDQDAAFTAMYQWVDNAVANKKSIDLPNK